MPKARPPAPPAQKPRRATVQATVIEQKEFASSAAALAAKLGWDGEETWEANGITVRDAQRYIQKVLHEAFAAAAKGLPMTDVSAAAEHLSCDAGETAALAEALRLSYEAGKEAPLQGHRVKARHMDAELEGSALSMLNKFLEAEGAE